MTTTQSTEPYKGVRDFYPEDYFIRAFIEETMAQSCEEFGFERYDASVLEPAELYKSKTSDEIVNEQTYTFTDRGDREVTLRPEMTPTVARMVAGRKRELAFPLRWYSNPNVFRYERPQRGRLREHWQLNADLFGIAGVEAEIEIIALASHIMRSFGATDADFEIHINDRTILSTLYDDFEFREEERKVTARLLDARKKLSDFEAQLTDALGDKAKPFLARYEQTASNARLEDIRAQLSTLGIQNVIIDTGIIRGFDYYTGLVFEVFDTAPENNRALFGGGRYDNLMELFDTDPLPTVGFGVGDVTMRDFLDVHGLLPTYRPATELMLCVVDESATPHAQKLATFLRQDNVMVAINYAGKKLGDQIKTADKLGIPFIIPIGEKEAETEQYTIRELATRDERTVPAELIAEHMMTALG